MQTYHTGLYNVVGNYQHLVLQSNLFLSSSNVIVQLVLLGIGSQQWPTWQQDALAQQVHQHTHHKLHCLGEGNLFYVPFQSLLIFLVTLRFCAILYHLDHLGSVPFCAI